MLGLIALGLALVAAEVALRLAAPRSVLLRRVLHRPGEAPAYDRIDTLPELLAATPFHPTPFVAWGDFKLDSRGLRTHEYERAKAPGTYRVVVLGDSFAFDSGFAPWDRIWHHRVGRALEERLGRPVEVINLGVPAVGPRFYRRMFEIEGRFLDPDLVLLSLFVGNDLTDESGARGSVLQRSSFLWRFLTAVARHPRALVPPPVAAPRGPGGHPIRARPYDPESPLNDPETFQRINEETARLFERGAWAETERRIGETASVVEEIGGLVRAAGAELVVVLVPDRIELEEETREAAGLSPEEAYDFDRVHAALAERFRAAGIPTVDLLPALREKAGDRRLYRRLDTHWSAEGNALAAERIVAALEGLPSRATE